MCEKLPRGIDRESRPGLSWRPLIFPPARSEAGCDCPRVSQNRACAAGRRQLACCVVVGLLVCGCAAIKATQQPGKKVLERAHARHAAIAGDRRARQALYSEERDGTTADIFCLQAGLLKGVKAGRAAAWRTPTWPPAVCGRWWAFRPIAGRRPRHQRLKVTDDDRRSVRSIEMFAGEELMKPRRLFARRSKSKSKPKAAPVADEAIARQESEAEASDDDSTTLR